MLELVLTLCLSGSAIDCRYEKVPIDGSILACARASQFVAADVINNHPKWRVERMRCGPVEHSA